MTVPEASVLRMVHERPLKGPIRKQLEPVPQGDGLDTRERMLFAEVGFFCAHLLGRQFFYCA